MLSWDDFRYVKAIADTGTLRSRLRVVGFRNSVLLLEPWTRILKQETNVIDRHLTQFLALVQANTRHRVVANTVKRDLTMLSDGERFARVAAHHLGNGSRIVS